MSLQDRGISPHPIEEDFRTDAIVKFSRKELLDKDAFSELEHVSEVSEDFAHTLRLIAKIQSIKEFIIVHSKEYDLLCFDILQEEPKADSNDRALSGIVAMNLRMDNFDSMWTTIPIGQFVEDVEMEEKKKILEDPDLQLIAVCRFTD